MRDMRDKHLTSEEIIKYMDASDLSEDYLLWMEETAEHILTCDVCQEKLNRAMTAESICDEEGLAAGLKLMEYEEEIRKNILITHLYRMREQTRIAELIKHIQSGYVERFTFSMTDLRRSAGVVRGTDQQCGQQVTLEKLENKLLLRIPGEMGKENRIKTAGANNEELQYRLMVILHIEGEEPIVKEAFWDEACGQYVAEMDGCGRGEKLEIYVDSYEV